MLIFDDNNRPIIVDNLHTPQLDHMWVLDLAQRDFTLTPIKSLEQTICTTLEVTINGFPFLMPTHWNILVYDTDTSQLDIIQIANAAGRHFSAFVYGPTKNYVSPATIHVTSYMSEAVNISPTLQKHHMLCHPISQSEWVSIAPTESYNKYIKNATVGDII